MKAPYFRLNYDKTRAFLSHAAFGATVRQSLARYLSLHYPKSGAYVVGAGLEVLAFVNPVGVIELLKPPRAKIERHQCVNNDGPSECSCRMFLDPEVRGPWHLRKSGRHHPLCVVGKRARENWHEIKERSIVLTDGSTWQSLKLAENTE